MIIKIHSRGIGSGSGPVDYLLGKDRDREDARLDRGDPEQMVQLIDSTYFAQKYTSGVLSFAERDLEEYQKQQIMDSFERTLLPGLDKDQYSVLWVQHKDKDRLELNFVVANVELQSGKRLQPYYDPADRPRLNAWKDLVNDQYQLHDPNDPINKRELCTPNNLPKHKEEASKAITDGLLKVAENGNIKSRSDVIKTLEGAGFEIARSTAKSISIKDPDGGRNIRLKGKIYEQNFRFGKELRGEIERASEGYRADRSNRVQEARKTLDRLTERKRESNQHRYQRAEPTYTPDYIKNMDDRIYRYSDRDSPSMGYFDVPKPQDRQERRIDRTATGYDSAVEKRRGEFDNNELFRQQKPQEIMYSDEYSSRELERWLSSANGVLINDRTRKALTQSVRASTGTTKFEGSRFTQDVRAYTAGQSERQRSIQELTGQYFRSRSETSGKLEQLNKACQQLEWTTERLRETKQAFEQSVKQHTRAVTQLEKMNEPKLSYRIR